MRPFCIFLLCCLGFTAFGQHVQFKRGTQLVYIINDSLSKLLTVLLESLNPPAFSYTYDGNKGKITEDTTALETGMAISTQVTGNETMLKNATMLWVSSALFKTIRESDIQREKLMDKSLAEAAAYVEKERIGVKLDETTVYFKNIGRERQAVKVNGSIDSLLVYQMVEAGKTAEEPAYLIKFADGEKNHFITYVYLPERKLKLELKEIKEASDY